MKATARPPFSHVINLINNIIIEPNGWLIIQENFHYNGELAKLNFKWIPWQCASIFIYISNNCVYIIHHLLHNHYGCMTCVSLLPLPHHSFTLSSSSSPASILFMFHFWIFHIFWMLLLLLLLFDVSTLCPPAYIMRKIVCIVCPVLNFTWWKILCWCSFIMHKYRRRGRRLCKCGC